MVIFFVCTTAFIAFYLYHVIRDLKRVDGEIKQVAADVTKLTQDVQSLAKLVQVSRVATLAPPVAVSAPFAATTAPPPQDDDEDDESVNTEELKQILVDDDEEDDDEVYDEESTQETQTLVQEHVPSLDDLKKLKYDDIKDLCKKRGISIKGSKEQLIVKLSGSDN